MTTKPKNKLWKNIPIEKNEQIDYGGQEFHFFEIKKDNDSLEFQENSTEQKEDTGKFESVRL